MELFLVTNLIALTLFHTTFDYRINTEEKCNQEVIMSDGILNYVASRDLSDVIEIVADNYKWLGYCDAQHIIQSMQGWTDNNFKNEVFKVLRVENKAVGLIMYECYPLQNSSNISRLAVHTDFCNKGYASELLQYGIDDIRSRGISNTKLCCHGENKKALSLYEKKFNFHVHMPTWLHLTLDLSER